ncbi:hypothetical protein SCORR_v1c03740 [Spiroplasma corruscae]|uniref:Uncharacterized protein n=1 Tax=Spiroplasma corruscae TaxID=216934 RepID=A0A222ENS9_9MOLU|nr:hypothetical protein [Spiroplasma corruscae]ASP28148.1 hypothetical protein SCORR_v1c03740 [Spiroplasma corruscae]
MKLTKFNKCIKFIFKTTLSSVFTYIYILLIPLIIEIFLYVYYIKSALDQSRIILVGSALMYVIPLTSLFITNLIVSWRETIFLKQIRNFGITQKTFISSLFIVYSIYCLFSIIFSIFIVSMVDVIENNHKMTLFLSNFFHNPSNIFSILIIMVAITFTYFISVLLSGFIKNIYIIQAISILFIILSLFTGDYFLDFNYIEDNYYQFFSYFNLYKYFNWLYYISYTSSFNGGRQLFLIVIYIDNKLSFNNIYIPLFSSLIVTLSIITSSYLLFKLSTK